MPGMKTRLSPDCIMNPLFGNWLSGVSMKKNKQYKQ